MKIGNCRDGDVKYAELSNDGACIVSNFVDNRVACYILPQDLLDGEVHQLEPYSTVHCGEPTLAVASFPLWKLTDESSCCFLAATRDHPIRLFDLRGNLCASYPLINHRESFLAPHSIIYSHEGTSFYCGTQSMISMFDLNRPTVEPDSFATVPTRHTPASVYHQRGILSAMALSSENILVAGSFSKSVGLYRAPSLEAIGVFNAESGEGVTQTIWSPCGRYLYIASRKSLQIEVWDIRSAGKVVRRLRGRRAMTNQRMGIALSYDGKLIAAGGVDGKIQMWAGESEQPAFEMQAHKAPVTSVAFHSSDTILMSASAMARPSNDLPEKGDDEAIQIWDIVDISQIIYK